MISKVENTIELVKNSPASLFTKEDVIKLLNEVSDVPAGDVVNNKAKITEEQVNELIDAVRFDLGMGLDSEDMVDYDSARFELDGDTISVTSIDVNTDSVEDIAEDAIRKWFDNNVL